jgi:plastocyanin
MRRILIALVAGVALVGAACGGDGGGGDGGEECTEETAVDLTGDNPFSVTIAGFAFSPNCFKAASASAITVTNEDSAAHTFTLKETPVDVKLSGGDTFNGESAGLAPGTYDLVCLIHPQMTGTVFVV